MAYKALPEIELLRQAYAYNPETGILVCRVREILADHSQAEVAAIRNWNSTYAGREAGCDWRAKYRSICINQTRYYAHRIIWLMHYGEPPVAMVDHINGNGLDNRIANLRQATASINSRNKLSPVLSNSGHRGVYKRFGKYRAVAKLAGKWMNLGVFDNKDEAVAARLSFDEGKGFSDRHLEG